MAGRYGGLLRALALSIVFHILLLWPAAVVWRESAPTAPMVARLRPSSAPVEPAANPDILPKPVPVVSPEQRRESKAASPLIARPEAEALPIAEPEPLTTETNDRSESGLREARPAIASALPPNSGLDADGLRSYRVALAREARRHKRYPARAIEAGWEGAAELQVTVTRNAAPTVRLLRSSGHAALDNAALEMLGMAIPSTALPASLKGQDFSVDLPVVFELPQ